MLAESPSEIFNSAGYDYVKRDVYLPVLNLTQHPNPPSKPLSDVAIQGSFRHERRNYTAAYEDLLESLKGKPFYGR